MNKNKNINNTATVLSRMYLYSKQMWSYYKIEKWSWPIYFYFVLFLSTKQKLPREEL